MTKSSTETIGVIGLGYVGLPVALAFAKHYNDVYGYDIDPVRVDELNDGVDDTSYADSLTLGETTLKISNDPEILKNCTFFVVTVPTSIDIYNNPDLEPVCLAAKTIGQYVKKGDLVCLESTVYPGVTENIFAKIISKTSGLAIYQDFQVAYSPERINPGDVVHRLENTVKVVAGHDQATLERVSQVYSKIIEADIFKAVSIRVAEAAKVTENTQRDINIALMNELSLLFDKLGIRTKDVLDAANTKWNFLPFTPGLVGGHCIGIDPYYLTTAAQEVNYHPEIILAGRRINDSMGSYVASRTVKLLTGAGVNLTEARVGILGITFKENCGDIRNSRIPDIINELNEFFVDTLVHDPIADPQAAKDLYNIDLVKEEELKDLDAVVIAVRHREYVERRPKHFEKMLALGMKKSIIVDVKSIFSPQDFSQQVIYWAL